MNEITSVTFPGGSPVLPEHDKAGNLEELPRPTGGKDTYTYDSWNRLVKAEYDGGTPVTLGEYSYDARHRRISALTDTNLNGTLDESREYYYADSWRIIEEHIDGFDSAQTPDGVVDRIAQQIYGIRGLNDAIARRIDDDPAVLDGYEKDFYLLCDVLGSCVALIDETARLYERVVYEPYGKGRHRWAGDVNFDGVVNMVDVNLSITDPWGTPPDIGNGTYIVDKDLDRLGTNNSLDLVEIFQWMSVGATPLGDGLISSRAGPSNQPVGPDCRVGYTGHTFMPEGRIYDMRNRDYSPRAGRFVQRDPIGYVDGMSLYEYVGSGPLGAVDPLGLRIWVSQQSRPGSIHDIMQETHEWNPSRTGPSYREWQGHLNRLEGQLREWRDIESEFEEYWKGHRYNTECTPQTANGSSALKGMAWQDFAAKKGASKAMRGFYGQAGTAGASMVPGIGESMDLHTIFAPGVPLWARGLAGLSLGANALTAGLLPNFGALRVAGDAGWAIRSIDEIPEGFEGIYHFKDARGTRYVGQTGTGKTRFSQHSRSRNLPPGADIHILEVPGGKTAREVKEHTELMRQTGGVHPSMAQDKVSNIRQPLGKGRAHLRETPGGG